MVRSGGVWLGETARRGRGGYWRSQGEYWEGVVRGEW